VTLVGMTIGIEDIGVSVFVMRRTCTVDVAGAGVAGAGAAFAVVTTSSMECRKNFKLFSAKDLQGLELELVRWEVGTRVISFICSPPNYIVHAELPT
jgi:hypothetical protein